MAATTTGDVVRVLKEVQPLLATIGRSIEGVCRKTLERWFSGRTQPDPDSVTRVGMKLWAIVQTQEARPIRESFFKAIKRVVPDAQTSEWVSANEFAAWLASLANPQSASIESTTQVSTETPQPNRFWRNRLKATVRVPANPFTWRSAIRDPQAFFGRENELRRLRDFLRNGQNVQVVGPRRIGKSSLLLAVGHRTKEWLSKPAFAYVDMQDAACQTMAGWLQHVASAWHWKKTPAEMAEFSERVEEALRTGRRLVLALDECEKFVELRDEFRLNFFETLRACGQKGLSIVTATQVTLRQVRERGALLSPWYNTFPVQEVGPFRPDEARGFVSAQRPGVPSFTKSETEAILEWAAGHPLKLQVACYNILEARVSGVTLLAALRDALREADQLLPSQKPGTAP